MESLLASIDPFHSLAGFVVGVLVGQTGVGGGALMTPALVLLFGVAPAVAVGTDLLFAAITKTVGALVHGKHGTVDWRIAFRLAIGSVPMTLLVTLLLAQFELLSPGVAVVFAATLSAALMLTGVALLLREPIRALGRRWSGERPADELRGLTIAAGLILGVLVPLSSVGAGSLGIVMLIVLYPGQRLVHLVGADLAHAVPLTLLAGIGHWAMGSVDPALLAGLLAGSLPGVALGALLSGRLPESVLRPVLALLLLTAGVAMAARLAA